MDKNIARRNFRAQFWSFDVMFAIIIFITALTILGFTWYNVNNQLSLGYGSGAVIAQLQAHSLAQNLLSSGSPANWQSLVNTTNSVTWKNVSIGLGTTGSSGNLSASKLYAFMAMANNNYQATKLALGTGYNYFVIITGSNLNMTIGSNPGLRGALSIYVEKRSATLNGVPVTMQILLWSNSSAAIS